MQQNHSFNRTKKILIGLVDAGLYYLSFILSFYLRYSGNIPEFNYRAFERSAHLIIGSFILLNILFGIYIFYNKSIMDFFYLTVIVQILMSFVTMALTFYSRLFSFPRSVIGISFVVSSIILILWRIMIFKLYQRIDGTKTVMVVGDDKSCIAAIDNFEQSKNNRHEITTAVTSNFYNNVKNNYQDTDIVYLTGGISVEEMQNIVKYLTKKETSIFLKTNFSNLALVNPNIMNIEDESIIEVSSFKISPEDGVLKRLLDLIVSFALIIMTSPIMIIAALLVKITSPGPILYKQTRITKDEQEFSIFKFRTMSSDAEQGTGPVLATHNDVRVTKIGKHFRSLRIDELPQLFNVLKGDMSLVGPRPERPYFVDQFNELSDSYYLRHNVRAGITGYAQVYGKYTTDFESKLNFDLVYIKNYSFVLDVKIMLQTIKILFDKVSSKGLEEEVGKTSKEKIPVRIRQIN